jgi:hypothetical protein
MTKVPHLIKSTNRTQFNVAQHEPEELAELGNDVVLCNHAESMFHLSILVRQKGLAGIQT